MAQKQKKKKAKNKRKEWYFGFTIGKITHKQATLIVDSILQEVARYDAEMAGGFWESDEEIDTPARGE